MTKKKHEEEILVNYNNPCKLEHISVMETHIIFFAPDEIYVSDIVNGKLTQNRLIEHPECLVYFDECDCDEELSK